jgi:hypothetical protein
MKGQDKTKKSTSHKNISKILLDQRYQRAIDWKINTLAIKFC